MFQKLILATLIISNFGLRSQSASTISGARASGMGNISGLNDPWGSINNIATITTVDSKSVLSSYEIKSNLVGANKFSSTFILPSKLGNFSSGFFRFGNEVYNEHILNLGFANKIGNTSIGGRISYIQYNAEGFGTSGNIGMDIGSYTNLSENLAVSIWIHNLNQPKIYNSEKLPLKLFGTLIFKITDQLLVATELEKDILYAVMWKTGAEYKIHNKVFIRMGINLFPNSFYTGIGYHATRIKIDYSLQNFNQFSFSQQASFSYQLTKKPIKQ